MQLMRTKSDSVAWTGRYVSGEKDVFVVQEKIAEDVVRALRVRFASSGPLIRHGTTDVAAYDLFLKGKHYRDQYDPEGLRTAIRYFEQAVARDPNYAEAWAWLGSTHTLMTVFAGARVSDELPRAREAVDKAIALDSALADAHWMRGEILGIQDHDLPGSIREDRLALAIDPSNVQARFFLAMATAGQGKGEEALSLLSDALKTDPLRSEVMMVVASVYYSMIPLDSSRHLDRQARLDSAVHYLREAVGVRTGFSFARGQLGLVYLAQGKRDSALTEFEKAASSGAPNDSAVLAYGYATSGRVADARAILARLLASAKTRSVPPTSIATIYVGLHDNDKAFLWLDSALVLRDPLLGPFRGGLQWLPLREDPRYGEFLRRTGMTP
jgi:serine/threonine-protein kinase